MSRVLSGRPWREAADLQELLFPLSAEAKFNVMSVQSRATDNNTVL